MIMYRSKGNAQALQANVCSQRHAIVNTMIRKHVFLLKSGSDAAKVGATLRPKEPSLLEITRKDGTTQEVGHRTSLEDKYGTHNFRPLIAEHMSNPSTKGLPAMFGCFARPDGNLNVVYIPPELVGKILSVRVDNDEAEVKLKLSERGETITMKVPIQDDSSVFYSSVKPHA